MSKAKQKQLAALLSKFDICGYDIRLSWDDQTFDEWVLEMNSGLLQGEGGDSVGDVTFFKSEDEDAAIHGGVAGQRESICLKRKCGKHQYWQKVRLEEMQLEERLWEERLQKLEEERVVIWERVKRRRYRDREGSREGRIAKEV